MEERFLEAIRARGWNASISKGTNQGNMRVQVSFSNGDFYIRVPSITEENSAAILAVAESLSAMRGGDEGAVGAPMIFHGV